MKQSASRPLLIALLIGGILAVAGGMYLLLSDKTPASLDGGYTSTTTPVTTSQPKTSSPLRIGTSVEGRPIQVFTYGDGPTHLLFAGGIHGGYEWNSIVLSWQLIDYLKANPGMIPENVQVSVIPTLNPDGQFAALGKAGRITTADVPANADFGGAERFNANGVDLNRNFGCNWQSTSTWRGQEVSAGASAFSEPEAKALRDYVNNSIPNAAVFFHSAAGAVYGAACDGTLGPGTDNLLSTYADASGYRSVDLFSAYPVTGDVESWLTKQGIPAISVELTNHTDIEWQKNLAGVKALLDYYSQQ